jgi:hypothetical protein
MNEQKDESDVSEDTRADTWTEDINKLCFNILDNTKNLMEIHKEKYLKLKYNLSFFKVPIIVLSSINSVFSVGLSMYIPQQTVSITNCFISLICGIISAIELYLGIQKQMENELSSYHQLKILAIKISHQMKLNPKNRSTEGTLFLNDIMAEYKNIFESSLVNNEFNIIDDKLFKYKDDEEPIKTKNKLLEFRFPTSPSKNKLEDNL